MNTGYLIIRLTTNWPSIRALGTEITHPTLQAVNSTGQTRSPARGGAYHVAHRGTGGDVTGTTVPARWNAPISHRRVRTVFDVGSKAPGKPPAGPP